MAVKENQHYVPKFYLKIFSNNFNNKEIGVYIVKNRFHFDHAPLKSQACKPYYYGKDLEIEDWLGEFESKTSFCFKSIIGNNSLPPKSINYKDALLKFVILFEMRNPVGAENFEKFLNLFAQKYPNITTIPDGSKIKVENHSIVKLAIFEKAFLCCKDLNLKLLINETSVPFLTSDNPMVKYNQFLERHKYPYGITGFMTSGLQIFLPISSAHMLIFYDGSIYKMGNYKDVNVIVTDEKEIDQLNILQCLNAYDVVFYNHYSNSEYVLKLINQAIKYNKPHQPILEEIADSKYFSDNIIKNSNMVIQSTTQLRINLKLKFMRELSVSKIKSINTSEIQLRKIAFDAFKNIPH